MPDVLSKEELLEKRVDAMMSVEQPEPEEVVPPTEEKQPDPALEESKPEPVQPQPQPVLSAPLLSKKITIAEAPKPKRPVKPELAPHPALIDDIVIRPPKLHSPKTDAAIADIARHDSDKAIAAEDEDIQEARLLAAEQDKRAQKDGHPIFWFFVLLFSIVCLTAGFYMMRPDLFQRFLP